MLKWIEVAGAIVMITSTGCAGSLAAMSSGEVGCPPSEVEVTDIQTHWSNKTWTATCRGQRFYCTGSETKTQYAADIHVECTAERDSRATTQGAAAATGPAATKAGSNGKVSRHYDEASGTQAVGASFGFTDKGRLTMAGSPAKAMGVIQVAYEASTFALTEGCGDLDVVVNAVPHEAREVVLADVTKFRRRLSGFTEFQIYKPLANDYPEFEIRFCGKQQALDEGQIKTLKKFLSIYSSLAVEHQRAAAAESSGSETPPAGSVDLESEPASL